MEWIELIEIKKEKNQISYVFSVSDGLRGFFSETPLAVEYSENIEAVPDCIAAIPFVSNVLPLIWLADAVLYVKKLDKAFYECIPNVRGGFEKMFPECRFAGRITVEELIECDNPASGGSVTLFSGGLDAVATLIRHLDEKPDLISIWGSDIRVRNPKGWEVAHKGIIRYAEQYNLANAVIKSTFREFDNEKQLNAVYAQQLKDKWWHGVKHGIGLLGHVAPYAYLHGISVVYIASSNCATDGHIRCSSNPLTDNHIRYANARVVHDGFECSRQDKARTVVDYVKRTGRQMPLRVCWKSWAGDNCCHCEKCYRTMVALIAEGADPEDYGFDQARTAIQDLQNYLVSNHRNDAIIQRQWIHIQNSIRAHRAQLRKHPDWKFIKWLVKADLQHPETLKVPVTVKERLRKLRARLHLS